MKRFAFSLGRILDYRESLLEREKNNLSALLAERGVLEEKIETLRRRFAEESVRMREIAAKGTTAAELQCVQLQIDACKRSIEQRLAELAELAQREDMQRETVKRASQDVAALEKLRDKQRADYDYAQRKEEEERIAELVSSKIARQQQ